MEYTLYGFRDSGFSYKVALLLNVLKQPWNAVFVDYHNGETKTEDFRERINLQGECPVLETSDGIKLTQSAAIMQYLGDCHNAFIGETKMHKYEILRWLCFDNHKFSSQIATHRYHHFVSPGALADNVHDFVFAKALAGLNIIDKQLSERQYLADTPSLSIADLSIAGYLLYPEEEFDFSISQSFPSIARVLDEIRALPCFGSPEQLLPTGHSQ